MMIFHVTMRHKPANCGAFSNAVRSLAERGWPMQDVRVVGVWAASHDHTWYFLLETGSYEAIWRSLGSFRELTTSEITPVHSVTTVSAATPFPYDVSTTSG
ncbi:MAG TPA: DUF3303 family protein [Dehalococcoidia bacterium]|nr:DUF3303 family protein [Dehalococcoidia bacterium]